MTQENLPENFPKKTVRLRISKSIQKKIRNGYPWVFDHQVRNHPDDGKPGDLGIIYDSSNKLLAVGLYDPESEIRLRILQVADNSPIGARFFGTRLCEAWNARLTLAAEKTTGYRAINGENDRLPGLIVDRYGDTLVFKIYTSAWFPHLLEIAREAESSLPPVRAILRLSRNLKETDSFHDGDLLYGPPLKEDPCFQENGWHFQADVLQGQKTGFFFDQRNNRARVGELARDCSVLNVFSYTGAFSIYAFAGHCRSVLEIDTNASALKYARKNMRLNFPNIENNANRYRQIQGNASKIMKELFDTGESFDLVILDPPAFARRKKHIPQALEAYKRLIQNGAKLTRPGGILFAASCSNPLKNKDFFSSAINGIRLSGKKEQELMRSVNALDHPVTFEEGAYLKAGFWKLVGGKKLRGRRA